MNPILKSVALLATALLLSAAQAGTTLQLRDLNNDGTIDAFYDVDMDITWLADASLSASNRFGLPLASDNFGHEGEVNPSGTMTWATAQSWIGAMNSDAYLGFSDWRLPTVSYPDSSCSALSGGHNCLGSEMGHLYYGELGGVANVDLNITHNSNLYLVRNIQGNMYWTGTGFTQAPETPNDNAWTFQFMGGVQQTLAVENFAAVWAVRDGDVLSHVPEPGTNALMLAGLCLVGFSRRRKFA
jgi:hypothetical protein